MRRARLAALALAMAAAACTTTGPQRVQGWPELTIVEHYVPQQEMYRRCATYAGPGMSPLACAEFDFGESRCDIWLSADSWLRYFVVEHERRHCQGYEHAGQRVMEERLTRYRSAQGGG